MYYHSFVKLPYQLAYKQPKNFREVLKFLPWNLVVYIQRTVMSLASKIIYLTGYVLAFGWCIVKVPYDEFQVFKENSLN